MPDPNDLENAASRSQASLGASDSLHDDVLDIIADVESRLERLRKVSREGGAVFDSIQQRQAALDKRQADLDERAQALEQSAVALQQASQAAEEREKRAQSLCDLADGERREIEQAKQKLDVERRALAQEREAIEQQRASLNREREQLAGAQTQCRAQAEALEADRGQLKHQLADLQAQRARCETEHRAALEAVARRMDEIQAERDERSTALQSQLDEARKQVAALREHLEAQRAESSRIEKSHRTELEQAALRSDSLQADLDAAQARASELETNLNKAQAELRARHEQLEATKRKLMDLGRALDGQTAQIEAGTAALAALEERDRRIAELESQLADPPAGGESTGIDPSELASRDERIAALQEEITSLEAQVQAAAHVAPDASPATDEELARRDQAIEDLSNHIRTMQQSLNDAQAQTAQRLSEINDLRKTIEDLQARPIASPTSTASAPASDEFVALRRQRLARMRRAIRDRSRRLNKARDVVKQQAHQVREFEDEQRTLADVRRNLELAEQRMIRRWARSSAVTNLFLLVLTLSILGGASYFGVMTFWPTVYAAHATIEAKGKPGFPPTDTQLNLWQTVHEEMLLSDTVVNGIAQRLEQRGYTDLSQPANLRTFLESNLVTGSPQPGTIELVLTTRGRDEAQRLLETYSIGVVSASNAERGRRTDGATTSLTVPATVEPEPVNDNRLQVAGITFGSSVGGLLLLGVPLYLKLRRSASVFADEDLDAPLMDADRWDKISKGSTQSAEHVIS